MVVVVGFVIVVIIMNFHLLLALQYHLLKYRIIYFIFNLGDLFHLSAQRLGIVNLQLNKHQCAL